MKNKKMMLFIIITITFFLSAITNVSAAAEDNQESEVKKVISPSSIYSNEITSELAASKFYVWFNDVRVPVGSKVEYINPADFIEDVEYDGTILEPEEYKVEFVDIEEDAFYVVDYFYHQPEFFKAKISLVENDEIFVIEEVPYLVELKNTIASRNGIWTIDTMVSSLSLLEDNELHPYLNANYGSNQDKLTSRVSTTTSVDIYQDNNKVPLLSLNTEKDSTHLKNTTIWNQKLEGFTVNYGNVLKQTVYSSSGSKQNGLETYVSRNERFIRETHGIDGQFGLPSDKGYYDAYYEITPGGYRLLQLNQLSMSQTALVFEMGDSEEEIAKQAASAVVVPDHLKNDTAKFSYELTGIDTSASTKGSGNEGTMNVYETLETGGQFMISYKVMYQVKEGLKLNLNPIDLPVGTDVNEIDLNDYVTDVFMGTEKLNPSEYTVGLDNEINTNLVSNQETKIKVVADKSKKMGMGTTKTNVVWGHSIVTKIDSGYSNTTISLLTTKDDKPYLKANEGTGFSSGNLLTRPFVTVYRENTVDGILLNNMEYVSADEPAAHTMDKFNTNFDQLDLRFGDVIDYSVNTYGQSTVSEMGERTWVSRNEELVKETEGFANAYYELTPQGYHLLRLNQMIVKSDIPSFDIDTSMEDMNKTAAERMTLGTSSNPNDYRFEYASVDTKTSGQKTTKMNVYEKLATGGEFMTTYDVKYNVKPQVIEKYIDDSGKEIKTAKTTSFEVGTSYQAKADNYVTFDNETYIYQGWLTGSQTPGKDKLNEGQPPATKESATYQYIYAKADNMINMTIPTELIFGTDEKNDGTITSKNYEIKNNSKEVSTEVILETFEKEKSDVKLLTAKDKDPETTEKSARLNLIENNKIAIDSLTENTQNQTITKLTPGEETSIGISGNYFGDMNERVRVKYGMTFKFKAFVTE